MRKLQSTVAGLALIAVIAIPAIAVGDTTPPQYVTVFGDPTVHVTPDRVAEIPFVLASCANSLTCIGQIALYGPSGRRLTQTAPAAFLDTPGSGDFPGFRLTPAAWRSLTRSHRLAARLVLKLPAGATQLLGYETLLAPMKGQARWCSGPVRPLAPPCHGSFRVT
jgi:hypothetical protein